MVTERCVLNYHNRTGSFKMKRFEFFCSDPFIINLGNSEWFRTRLSPLLRSKAGQVKLWGLPKNVSLPKTLKNASLEILKIRS